MKKIKILLLMVGSVIALNSCTVLALGTGAAIGGYTCTKTDVCDKVLNKGNNSNSETNLEEENVEVEVN